MENNQNSQGMADQMGGPLEGMSPQHTNLPDNDVNDTSAVYTELGLSDYQDSMNPHSEEASDTILYTDNSVARAATDTLADNESAPLPPEYYNDLDNVLSDATDEERDARDTSLDPIPGIDERIDPNDGKDRYLAY